MFGLGIPELLVIGIIVLLLFGADKLPGIARSLGKAISEFRKSMNGTDDGTKDKE